MTEEEPEAGVEAVSADLPYSADEPRFVADFGVGSAGVGPVAGFESDDFFPVPDPAVPPPSESD